MTTFGPLARFAGAPLVLRFSIENNPEMVSKRRKPIRLGRERLLFLPAARSNDQAPAGEGYAAAGCGKRADTIARKVGIRRGLMVPAHAGKLG